MSHSARTAARNGSGASALLGYATTPEQFVLGAGEPPKVDARPTPVANRPRGRWFLGSLVLALVGVGAHRVWDALLRYQAYGVVIGREVQVSPPWNGEVESVHVREGERVEQGALLVTLSNLVLSQDRTRIQDELRIAQADLAAELARLQLEEALNQDRAHKALAEYYSAWAELLEEQARNDTLQVRLERQVKLFESGVIAQDSLDQLREEASGQADKVQQLRMAVDELRRRADETVVQQGSERLRPFTLRIDKLQADLARAGERLAQGELRAPVPGTILRREAFVGEQASPDRPLLAILERDSERIRLFVPQEQASLLDPGQELEVEVEPVGALRCVVASIGDSYELPPPGVARHALASQMLLPVLLDLLPTDGHGPGELRLGALAKLARFRS